MKKKNKKLQLDNQLPQLGFGAVLAPQLFDLAANTLINGTAYAVTDMIKAIREPEREMRPTKMNTGFTMENGGTVGGPKKKYMRKKGKRIATDSPEYKEAYDEIMKNRAEGIYYDDIVLEEPAVVTGKKPTKKQIEKARAKIKADEEAMYNLLQAGVQAGNFDGLDNNGNYIPFKGGRPGIDGALGNAVLDFINMGRKDYTDGPLENVLEYIPFLGSALSTDDYTLAKEDLQGENKEGTFNNAIDMAGILPIGKYGNALRIPKYIEMAADALGLYGTGKDLYQDNISPMLSPNQNYPQIPKGYDMNQKLFDYQKNQPGNINFVKDEGYAMGGMIKRADGSYSKRGLWDNIRANKGSGKKPTKQMLEQEKKIKQEMAVGGMVDEPCPDGFVKDPRTGECIQKEMIAYNDSTSLYNQSIKNIKDRYGYDEFMNNRLLDTYLSMNINKVPINEAISKNIKAVDNYKKSQYVYADHYIPYLNNLNTLYNASNKNILPSAYYMHEDLVPFAMFKKPTKPAVRVPEMKYTQEDLDKAFKQRRNEEEAEKQKNLELEAEKAMQEAMKRTEKEIANRPQEPDYYSSPKMFKYSPEDAKILYELQGMGPREGSRGSSAYEKDLDLKLKMYKSGKKFAPIMQQVGGYNNIPRHDFSPTEEDVRRFREEPGYRQQWDKDILMQHYGYKPVDFQATNKRKQYAQGGQVPQNIPVEVEGGEAYELPNGQMGEFEGPSHENGGIPVALPEQTKVYSKQLKVNGKTMADRKTKREANVAKLEKILSKNPSDKFVREALKRQQETAALEEQQDMAMQEQANQQQQMQEQAQQGMMQEQAMAGLMQDPAMMQQMGMMMYGGKLGNGTPPYGLLNYISPTLATNVRKMQDAAFTEEQFNQLTNPQINPLDIREKKGGVNVTTSGVNPYDVMSNVLGQTFQNIALSKDPYINTKGGMIPNPLYNEVIGNKMLVEEEPKKPNKFMNWLNKAADETGDFFVDLFTKDKNKPKKEKAKKEETKSANELPFTPGDYMGMAGTLYGGLAPMTTTMLNRMMTPKNQNFFREYGAEGLRAMQEAQALSAINRDKQLADIKLGEEASRQRGRNSARGVNTLRAMDISSDIAANQAQNQAYNSYAQQMMQLLGQKAQMENQQDQAVMQGEYTRDLADRQDLDNFYTNLAENFASQSTLMQKQGKDINQALYNRDVLKLAPLLSRYGIGVTKDANGEWITYDVKSNTELTEEEVAKRLTIKKEKKEKTPKEVIKETPTDK